ncbi:MAG: hypothetical protein PUG15_06790 [Bacteroidales bacterium]|nr:hypothetical protein [Bacteroidales bacterium]
MTPHLLQHICHHHTQISLKHPFDDCYGRAAKDSRGTTPLLMDYAGGTHIAKWQWSEIYQPALIGAVFEREERGEMVAQKSIKWITTFTTPKQLEGTNLSYIKLGVFADETADDRFYKLTNDNIVHSYYDNENKIHYELVCKGEQPYPIFLSNYTNCLSCEVTDLLAKMTKETALLTARYAIPFEDMFILVTGEDLEGNEASRIAAGGFIILDIVQAGKILKFAKGFKTASQTSKFLALAAKDITKEATLDMSCQFVVNLMRESVNHPDYTDEELITLALSEVSVKNALLSGAISFASLNSIEQTKLTCAQDFFSAFQKGKEISKTTIGNGTYDCLVELAFSVCSKKIENNQSIQNLFKEFNTLAKQDIILKRLKNITSENIYHITEELLKKITKSTND